MPARARLGRVHPSDRSLAARRLSRVPLAVVLAAIASLLPTACGPAQDPVQDELPLRLAAGFSPSFDYGDRTPFGRTTDYPVSASTRRGDGPATNIWLECELPAEAWTRIAPGTYLADRPLGSTSWRLSDDENERLSAGGRNFERIDLDEAPSDPSEGRPGTFASFGDSIFLRLELDESVPEAAVYAVSLPRGERRDGAWRLELGQWSAEAVPVFTGAAEVLPVVVPENCVLHVGTLAISPVAEEVEEGKLFFGAVYGDTQGKPTGEVTFRIELDGETLLEHPQTVWTEGGVDRHKLSLPPSKGREVDLRFSVEGDAALGGFLTPRIAAANPTAPEHREQPDLFLFLADTFRADNMTMYGSELNITPNLDAFAERSLAFERAWTPGGWTLPSQTTMLTGLWPLQHGAIVSNRAIPEDALLISEFLAAHGYRCGAITDGGLIRRANHFDQGFEYFDERFRPLEQTVHEVEEFLEADDGRPVFLYVQTYRAHSPYRVSTPVLAEHGERLGIDRTYQEALSEIEQGPNAWSNHSGPVPPELLPAFRALEGHYRGGVLDTDRGFGKFLAHLEQGRRLEKGLLLFTSDHGEAFLEHEIYQHDGGAWEEQMRIPMLVSGAGLEPGRVTHPVSLIDVPATFADACGLTAPDSWYGTSLLQLDFDRTLATFETGPREDREYALLEGNFKLFGVERTLENPELLRAFDLAQDPGETANLAAAGDPELLGLRATLQGWLEERSTPLHEPTESEGGRAAEAALRALGYLDATEPRDRE